MNELYEPQELSLANFHPRAFFINGHLRTNFSFEDKGDILVLLHFHRENLVLCVMLYLCRIKEFPDSRIVYIFKKQRILEQVSIHFPPCASFFFHWLILYLCAELFICTKGLCKILVFCQFQYLELAVGLAAFNGLPAIAVKFPVRHNAQHQRFKPF